MILKNKQKPDVHTSVFFYSLQYDPGKFHSVTTISGSSDKISIVSRLMHLSKEKSNKMSFFSLEIS